MRRRSGALTVLGVCVALSVALSAGRLLPQADTVLEKLSVREADAHKSFFDLVWDGSPWRGRRCWCRARR